MRKTVTRSLAMAVALTLSACGITADQVPRDLPLDQRRAGEADNGAEAGPTGTSLKVYFLNASVQGKADRLQASSRDVAATPEAAINELLAGLNVEDRDRKLRTAIPPGTQLRSASFANDGTAVVDLDTEFFEARGAQQLRSVAQIVFTLAGIPGVREVRLLVDGQSREWPRGDGSLQARALTPADYAALDPSSQPDYLPLPSPTTIP